jgi:hypothetical protein
MKRRQLIRIRCFIRTGKSVGLVRLHGGLSTGGVHRLTNMDNVVVRLPCVATCLPCATAVACLPCVGTWHTLHVRRV